MIQVSGYLPLAGLTVPAVDHVSPSQMSKWAGCPMQWALSRVLAWPGSPWTAFGSRTHAHLEHWLGYGTPPPSDTPEGRCATAGLHLIPPPGHAMVEHPFGFDHGGVHYSGRIDMLFSYEPGRVVYVGDHKTLGDMRWAKTQADLAWDPQRVTYSHWAAMACRVPWVGAAWVHYQRKPPTARATLFVESAVDIAARFELYHRRVGLAIVGAAGRPVESFHRNLHHCHRFGGCPFQGPCLANVSTTQRAIALLSRNRSTP